MSLIPADEYARIIEALPILCVDVVVRNSMDEYLLVKRANEPLKDQWWVVGGRVLKGESLDQAAIRKVREEAGLEVKFVQPIGYYEDSFETNPFGGAIKLHSVSVVFSTIVDNRQKIRIDYQSSEWKYSKELPENFRIKSFSVAIKS
ncbi:MAG: NUDIX domain-containing protein [Desulfobacterales bacterium]|nr:NUDIX domain-containing protein [Desulfobacterales bacterium]